MLNVWFPLHFHEMIMTDPLSFALPHIQRNPETKLLFASRFIFCCFHVCIEHLCVRWVCGMMMANSEWHAMHVAHKLIYDWICGAMWAHLWTRRTAQVASGTNHTKKSTHREERRRYSKYLLITVDKSPITCSARSYQHRTAKHTYTQRRARV